MIVSWRRLARNGAVWLAAASTTAVPASDEARWRTLRAELEELDRHYFEAGAPLVPDETYDALRQEWEALEARYGARQPATAKEPTGSRPESEKMLSLDKGRSEADVARFLARVQQRGAAPDEFVLESKLDGVAVELTYSRGHFVSARSRGDGWTGDDFTRTIQHVRGFRLQLQGPSDHWPEWFQLRGEVYLPWTRFRALNESRQASGDPPFAHPRNVTAGALQRDDEGDVRQLGLELRLHGLGACAPAEQVGRTQTALYAQFQSWGFEVVPAELWPKASADVLWDAVQRRLVEDRGGDAPTDGVVLKVNDRSRQRELGATATAPRWALAVKPPAARAQTWVRNVLWQVSRLGELTPVAELEPVWLDGSLIARATLFGPAHVERLQIRAGRRVEIARAGGVIPQIVQGLAGPESDDPVALPTCCPGCGNLLRRSVAELRCPAYHCPERLRRRLDWFVGEQGMKIDGLTSARIGALVETMRLRTLLELFELEVADLAHAGVQSPDRVLVQLQSCRSAPLATWLVGLSLPMVTTTCAEQVAQAFDSLATIAQASEEQLRAAGLSEGIARQLKASLDSPEVQSELIAAERIRRATLSEPASVGIVAQE